MYNGGLVIDSHGHMSTPPHFRAYAYNLIALRAPHGSSLELPEGPHNAALERHLRLLDARQIDVQLLSPRPVAMMHWEEPHIVNHWTEVTNNVIAQQCKMHPTRFIGVGQLPQSPGLNMDRCVHELDRCIGELGFIGVLLNPDPAGDRQSPGLDQPQWFPLYAKAQELGATLVVHPSGTKDKRLALIPHPYQYNNLTEETLATMLLEHSDVFDRYPELKIMVCHCGGGLRRIMEKGDIVDASNESRGKDNVCYPSGEQGGGQISMGGLVDESHIARDLTKNLFFDTCAYDPVFLEAAVRQRGPAQMAFGTETPGAGSATMNPVTGKPSDDILATIDSFGFLSQAQKIAMVRENCHKVFPLLQNRMDSRGLA